MRGCHSRLCLAIAITVDIFAFAEYSTLHEGSATSIITASGVRASKSTTWPPCSKRGERCWAGMREKLMHEGESRSGLQGSSCGSERHKISLRGNEAVTENTNSNKRLTETTKAHSDESMINFPSSPPSMLRLRGGSHAAGAIPSSPSMLKVSTFNIWCPLFRRIEREDQKESQFPEKYTKRLGDILDVLLKSDSDIICLQEFWVQVSSRSSHIPIFTTPILILVCATWLVCMSLKFMAWVSFFCAFRAVRCVPHDLAGKICSS